MDQPTTTIDCQHRKLSISNAIAPALKSSFSLLKALRATVAYAAALLPVKTGWIWQRNPQTDDSLIEV
jgi:GAF domain-containing protein